MSRVFSFTNKKKKKAAMKRQACQSNTHTHTHTLHADAVLFLDTVAELAKCAKPEGRGLEPSSLFSPLIPFPFFFFFLF